MSPVNAERLQAARLRALPDSSFTLVDNVWASSAAAGRLGRLVDPESTKGDDASDGRARSSKFMDHVDVVKA
jgi:hypothetical protein